jgi:uncharacterized 2Fe-2S/4Fe-4S cluster protein (DUF4445 family)
MSFALEFEPLGIRLISEEPLTLLEAARQAGIQLRSECGGKGTCGKCRIQILAGEFEPPNPFDLKHLTLAQISNHIRQACHTVAHGDARLFIPSESLLQDQVLQTEGNRKEFNPEPAIKVTKIKISPPSLHDLTADLQRVQASLETRGIPNLRTSLSAIREISRQLRQSNWDVNLVHSLDEILTAFPPDDFIPLGLAVDVGSTKLACYLMDLFSGKTLAAKGIINPQIIFGEDIMSRLSAVLENPENAQSMQREVINAINHATAEMCATLGLAHESITDVCLVGNTAMHHLFLGLPTQALAMSPFIPALTSPLYPHTRSLGLNSMPGARTYAPPVIAGFVGSDHVAFLLASGFGDDQRIRLGIDIGTNTEIALQKGGRIVSVSTASGPAFEGAHIQYGMRAAPGAIEHVTIDEHNRPHCQVIGNQLALGMCGSGILDAVAELRRSHLMNDHGRLLKDSPAVVTNTEGLPKFILIPAGADQREIGISQKDIDQILLAKGAIRAGIDILLDYLKLKPEQIEDVVIAGAFGSYMNPEHAILIGMLPSLESNRIHAVGNAAGMGACMQLVSTRMRAKALVLAQKIEYLELTIYPNFSMFFAQGIRS